MPTVSPPTKAATSRSTAGGRPQTVAGVIDAGAPPTRALRLELRTVRLALFIAISRSGETDVTQSVLDAQRHVGPDRP